MAKSFRLDVGDVTPLLFALGSDGQGSLANACLSIGEAIGALDHGAYSWATIKLYYSTFYATRAWLSLHHECHLYLGHTPYHLQAAAGSHLVKGSGRSHEFAFRRLLSHHPTPAILSQDIGAEPAFDWLRDQRETVQYRDRTFVDPDCPGAFAEWTRANGRQLLDKYVYSEVNDLDYLSIFDPSEAMIGFPVRLTADVIRAYSTQEKFSLDKTQVKHLRSICRISGQPVSVVMDLASGDVTT